MSGPDEQLDLSGEVLGRYRLVRRLGQGGMGAVYLAQHEMLDRQVALKVLSPTLAAKEVARKRFLREARAASKVKHPGVVEIFDVAFEGDHVFFVMELLAGRDLADRIADGKRMTWAESQPVLVQVAEALAAAHEVGVIHRDVKPSNCFLVAKPDGSDGRVKVVDFGIAKVAVGERTSTEDLTTTGELFGTVGYMPLEMAQGIHNEPRSDIYELGVMMFRMLTGRLPFLGPPVQVIAQHIGKPPPAPRSLEASIPPEVETIILRALEKEPADRQPSMRHMAAELRALGKRRGGKKTGPRTAPMGGAGRSRPSAEVSARLAAVERNPRTGPMGEGRGGGHGGGRGAARAIDPAIAPKANVSTSDVIDLDERPAAPETASASTSGSASASRSSAADDPWKQDYARTTAYGEEPPPPPMPGEPDLPPQIFQPPPEDDLELEVDRPEPEQAPRRAPLPGWLLPAAGVGALAVAAGVALWIYREPIADAVPEDLDELQEEVGLGEPSSDADKPATVELTIETKPADAQVSVDGQLHTERPIVVPRSDQDIRVRVEAEGYEPRTTLLRPSTSRRLDVELKRSKKKKGKRK